MEEWRRFISKVPELKELFRVRVPLVLFLSIMIAIIGVFEPLVLKYFFDSLSLAESSLSQTFQLSIALLFILYIGRELIGSVQNWLVWKIRLSVQKQLQSTAISKLYSLPLSFHHQEGVGATMTKLERSINSLVGAFSEVAFFTLPTCFYLVISLYVMFTLDLRLTLIIIFFVPLPVLISMQASKEQTRREKLLITVWAKIFNRVHEVLSCLPMVKSMSMEKAEANFFLSKVSETNTYVMRGIKTDTKVGMVKNIIVAFAHIVVLAYGGYCITLGEMTLGSLIAFLSYIGKFFGPIQGITNVYQTYRKASVSINLLNEILEFKDPVADGKVVYELNEVKGEVEFDKVSFIYPNGYQVFSELNLKVNPGERIAIVGQSGAGKSTIVSLILRLYSPTSGLIKIDGHDLKLLRQRFIRNHIGVVLQDFFLFNDTISNNISYGAGAVNQEQIEAAAKIANAHDFIMQLPERYETTIGERGSMLSGGQRQRIAIARAILKDPAILILDEATSALDAEAETLVQEAFKNLVKGRTTFIISHKLANIVDVDKIVLLKDGRISKIITDPCHLKVEEVYACRVKIG
ncbi:ABC transporter ATP-binding protein [Pontibacter mangrovi]|uniref:ABC transporter ATP-binding protein n=1 Tax=Pontibacter mangrovi TaxID=2589816 RepID=A0A501W3V7_9BACT|nr:ABC transporter ATP-binding protein [Pontibacter mangrovi]TPE44279.1 ABC transporter ATP-binding protein [Pontibacter mangrovi]